MAKKKWYVVWKGRRTGIFTTWAECEAQVKGFAGARFKSFKTRQEAEVAYRRGALEVSRASSQRGKRGSTIVVDAGEIILPSISVDAACSGNPGVLEYRGVDTETKRLLFYGGPFPVGTNNLGEFLALVDGLRYLHEKRKAWPLYSDSRTAMAWVRDRRIKTTLERNARTQELFQRIDEALQWLRKNDFRTQILKWQTEKWGEIPADFGRK